MDEDEDIVWVNPADHPELASLIKIDPTAAITHLQRLGFRAGTVMIGDRESMDPALLAAMDSGRAEQKRLADRSDPEIVATVTNFDASEGWGRVDAEELPGGCFVHFSMIHSEGYRNLDQGQRVWLVARAPGQDGCAFSAIRVWTTPPPA